MTGRAAVNVRITARAMSERQLDDAIREQVKELGLRRFHPYHSRKSDPGWPDLVIVGPHGILYRELKREKEKPRPDQQAWLDALHRAGGDAGVWRPSDLISKRIASELTAISRFRGRTVPW